MSTSKALEELQTVSPPSHDPMRNTNPSKLARVLKHKALRTPGKIELLLSPSSNRLPPLTPPATEKPYRETAPTTAAKSTNRKTSEDYGPDKPEQPGTSASSTYVLDEAKAAANDDLTRRRGRAREQMTALRNERKAMKDGRGSGIGVVVAVAVLVLTIAVVVYIVAVKHAQYARLGKID
ncbi:hypothetical protein P171DRAFT_442315 [Karstenula rhodostoma CBS 690.94]|uniref:Uncharacterized protein n=1 Tax=Karstenula rhodostoma CBS 690.94 TaxID=1392251 RepID=A0A9P4PQH6_9PLEO|nr:hypothetical protein P171DRAFT_442315 [Karstenula rhodostoma CBS 690.94]